MSEGNTFAAFEHLLMRSLLHRKIPFEQEYSLREGNGTSRISIDLFVPSVPPIAVEFKNVLALANQSKSLLTQSRAIQETIGEDTQIVIVTMGKVSSSLKRELSAARNLLLFGIDPSNIESAASMVADEISKIVTAQRTIRRKKARDSGSLKSVEAFAVEADELSSLEELDQDIEKGLRGILKSFSELVSFERYEILHHEVRQLSLEYTSGHYTACALRVGRCLEYIVYSLAESWRISTDIPLLKIVDRIRRRTDEIISRVTSYRELPVSKQDEGRNRLATSSGELTNELMKMLVDFDEAAVKEEPSGTTPKNLESILRDFERNYGRNEQVSSEMRIIKESVRKLLAFRNDAAHASQMPEKREIEKEQSEEMLSILERIMLGLYAIGRAIQV